MALSQTQKKWAVGGGIGALVLVVGHGLFGHTRSAFASSAPRLQPPKHHKRKKHPNARRDRGGDEGGVGENERGEYGRPMRHRRKRHDD